MNARKANLFMLMIMVYQILLSSLLGVIYMQTGFMFTGLPLVWFSQFVGVGLPLFVFCKWQRLKLTDICRTSELGIKNALFCVAFVLLLMPFMFAASALSSFFFFNRMSGVVSSGVSTSAILSLFSFALIPAVLEELMFRGLIQTGYKNVPFFMAAWVNGLFFGIFHKDPQQLIYAFALGVFFSFIVYWTNSIYSAILSHMLFNGLQTLLSIATTTAATSVETSGAEAQVGRIEILQTAGVFFAIGLALSPLLIFLIRRFKAHNLARILREKPREELITAPPEEPKESPFDRVFFIVIGFYIAHVCVFYIL